MATVVDALLITMGLDTKGVQKGMQQAQSAISSGVKGIMGLLGPAVAGLGFKALMDDYVKTADTLGKTADRIGVSITALDSWGMAAQHAGGSSEAFQSSLESLNAGLQNLAMNGGKGKLAAPLAALGISAVDAAGKTKEPIQLLKDLAAVAHDMDAAKFAGLAAKLGLDKGTIGLLQQGDVEVEKLVKDMEKFAYTQEDRQVAEAYNDSVQDLGRAFMKVASIVMRVAVPAITWIADKITWLAKLISSNKAVMVATFGGIAAVILTKILPALKAFGVAWMTNPATLVITAIVAAVAGLLLLLDDFLVWMDGGESALGDFWQSWANFFNGIGELASSVWNWIKETAEALWNWLTTAPGEAVDAIVNWFSGLGDRIGEAWEDVKSTLAGAWDSIKSTASGAWESVKASASSAWERMKALPGELFQAVSEWFGQIVDRAANIGQQLWESFKLTFSYIFNEGKKKFQELWDWIVNLFSNIGEAIWDGIKGIGSKIGGAVGGAWDSFKGLFGGGDEKEKEAENAGKGGAPAPAAPQKAASPEAVAKDVGAGMAATGDIGAAAAVDNSVTNVDESQTTTNNNVTVNVTATTSDPGAVGQATARGAQTGMVNAASGTNKGGG